MVQPGNKLRLRIDAALQPRNKIDSLERSRCETLLLGAWMTQGDALVRRFSNLHSWSRRGERAPHKPLLALLSIGRIRAGNERLTSFKDLESDLKRLLIDFGPPRLSVHPEYPFWRLQRDGVWEILCPVALKLRRSNNDPLKSELLSMDVKGGFTEDIFRTLKRHPEIARALASNLLEAHFPQSIHSSIASSVGLDLNDVTRNPQRDGRFRNEVISAWGHRCGFCGYDLKLDNADLGLEAAHLRWVQAGGPDTIDNGICCCSLHHQALDRGGIGVDLNLRIMVSSRLHGYTSFNEGFLRLKGAPLVLPGVTSALPRREFLEWHRAQVFRGEPRN